MNLHALTVDNHLYLGFHDLYTDSPLNPWETVCQLVAPTGIVMGI